MTRKRIADERPVHRDALKTGRPGAHWAVPGALFFALFALVPLGVVIYLSFTTWKGLGDPQWTGLTSWQELFRDRYIPQSVWIMLGLLVATICVQLPVAALLGTWAAGPQRNRAVLASIYFLPLLLSTAAIAIVWKQLMDPNFGLPAHLKELVGGTGDFIGTSHGALITLVMVGAWQYIPFHMLLFQGAVRSIPDVLYQAAEIDGAGRVRCFFSITLPQLRNTIITSLIFMVVGGLTGFDTVLILTMGGPGRDTTTTPLLMYFEAFRSYHFGKGSAIAVLLIVVATTVSLLLTRLSGYDRMESTKEGV
ncbi:MAG: sugar ABC transporter permease [Bifidobacteriaceae bacterium]|jgi:xylobiose transport system permease protein|nr:sugar ABC transporter permease [Bifidobacteriaceae bacterium]